jgi:radical SAM superfamily enzyme YgiQ (UPF0313 family)
MAGENGESKKLLCPPLTPAAIAAITPPEVDVSITDENVTTIDFQKEADLVGITVLTATAKRAYQIADFFRARGVKVVLGGIHASTMPDEASEHADAVVIGEAEGIWLQVIEDFKAGRLQKIYRQHERPSLVGLPLPRRDLFKEGAYFIPNTISTTRGCSHNCSFCSVTLFFGRSYRCRPIAEVIIEIKAIDKETPIIFVDDNIVGKPSYAKELFRALIPLKLKWLGQSSVNIAKDEELLKLAAASGCIGLLIGFESLSPASLAGIGKKINVINEYEAVIRKIHSYNIGIHGCFIFGLDDDDEDIFKRTVRFAQKTRLESAQFSFATPHPGTTLYKSLDEAGRIVSKDWSKYNDEIVFLPKPFSREILQKGHDWASPEFYSLPSIFSVPTGAINFRAEKNRVHLS